MLIHPDTPLTAEAPMHRRSLILLLLAVALVALHTPARAASYVLYPNGTGDATSIQHAVELARDGDEIVLADGVFTGEGNHNVSLQGKALTIRSMSGDPARTVVDVNGIADNFIVERAFDIINGEGPQTVIRDITITGGNADGPCPDCQGGAIYVFNSQPTLINITFTGNFAYNGAGLFVEGPDAHATVDSCRFITNRALTGGGVEVFSGGTASFTRCVFVDNVAGPGGLGGAIRVFQNATLHLDRCTVAYNSTSYFASAFEFYDATVLIENSIIAQNGGGTAVGITEESDVFIRYSLIHGNAGENWPKDISMFRNRFGNIDLAVGFQPAPGKIGQVLLQADSPAIDAGDPNAPLDPDGTRADMGAYPFDQLATDIHAGSRATPTVSGAEAGSPGSFRLSSAYPNPFNGQVRAEMTLPDRLTVRVVVRNVLGQQVAVLADGPFAAGNHTLAWDATDHASGMYLLIAERPGQRPLLRKLVHTQ